MPPDLQILRQGADTRFILPLRKTTNRFVGCFPIVFGLIFVGAGLATMISISGIFDTGPAPVPLGVEADPNVPPPPPQRGWDVCSLISSLFGLPFVVIGMIPVFAGLGIILPNRAEISITQDFLVAVSHFGPFRFRRRRPINEVTGLRVANPRISSKGSAEFRGHTIVAECATLKSVILASRYPREYLAQVAEEVARELRLHSNSVLRVEDAPQSLAVTVEPEPPPSVVPPPPEQPQEVFPAGPQPPDSPVQIAEAPESLTLIIPPGGIRSASFFFIFAGIWLGITGFVGLAFVVVFFQKPSLEDFIPVCFISVFVAIGLVFLLAGIQVAFRKAVILALRDELIITQKGPLRNSEYHWKAADVKTIQMGDSGTTVNGKCLQQLHIQDATGTKQGFFTGRKDPEIHWLAAKLREFYHLPG